MLEERREGRGAQTNDHARVGAELAGTHHHGSCKFLGHGFATRSQSARQQDDRVDARHFGEDRDRLWTLGSHFAQCVAAVQRAGKADSLDGRVLDQAFAHAVAEDHVEHAFRHAGGFSSTNDCAGNQIGCGHVTAVGLEHHWATGGQCGSGVTASSRESQREVAGTEHGNRTDADAVLAQVNARQRLAVRQGLVDARTDEVTTAQDFGEQAHLAAGTAALTLDAHLRQGGFLADDGDEIVTQLVQLVGNRVEELGAAGRAQLTVFGEGVFGSQGRSVDFAVGGLMKAVGQFFARGGIQTFLQALAQSAAAASDEVLAENVRHRYLLLF